ncbi:autotransporter secretion outer membrane protein TamA [Phyllobacterium sp. YR620]|uniref:autotransporter assembly complex protein TamA n=1 Tax=unclassified Phyllobacterium TaxID=2638441 RepID=UPI00068E6768|nr:MULTISPECIES: autotransporter assembly complex family protein [unclassified Phyllobacterium]SDP33094.1 autotransporter secretion outer membrane protein TamA [Phyllobacterium sp. YR620]
MELRRPQAKLFGAALLAFTALVSPAQAFDLFGIHLWGERKTDDADAVIADPHRYSVENAQGEDKATTKLVAGASSLVEDEDKPASGAAGLIAKARGDYRRILGALYADGRYGGTISIKIDGREAADIPPDADLPNPSTVVIAVDPGPQFLFASTRIKNMAPLPIDPKDVVDRPEDQGFAPGDVATSTAILKAERLAVDAWREQGHPKARIVSRDVVANHDDNRIDATIDVEPDRRAAFGPVTVRGTERMDPEFVAFITGLQPGVEYDPDEIERAKKRLSRLEVFRSARIEEADAITPNGLLPITVAVQEQKLRRFGLGGSYSTLDGAGFEAYWLHRNLFGHAERLRFDAKIGGIGGQSFNPQDYNYLLGVTFTKPGVFNPDTDFVTSLIGERQVLDAYTQTSITAQGGFTRIFSDELTGKIMANVAKSRFDDDFFGKRDFLTAGFIGGLTYDSRDNKVDPSKGYYLEGLITPFYEFEYGNFASKFTAEGRTYYSFDADKRFILAGRLKLGSIVGADIAELPPDQLFFAGGGGSIRGYAYRNVGVNVTRDGEDFVIGGRSLVESSVEARVRMTDTIGVVGFVDAGYVGEQSYPDFSEQLRVGVGAGLRYNTGLGPIRLDFAVPLDRTHDDPDFALYVGIGQAF